MLELPHPFYCSVKELFGFSLYPWVCSWVFGFTRQREKSVFIEFPLFLCCILFWAQSACVLLRIYSRRHCFLVWDVQPWIACPGQRLLGWREQPRVQWQEHSCSQGCNFSLCMHNMCCCSITSSWSSAPVCVCNDPVLGGRGATAV